MTHFNITSPRIASTSFLAMCATAGMPSPAITTTPTILPMAAPTEWLSQIPSAPLPKLDISVADSSLLSRRRLNNTPAVQGLGIDFVSISKKTEVELPTFDIGELKLSPTLAFVDKTPSTPDFAFFNQVNDGMTAPMLEYPHSRIEKKTTGLDHGNSKVSSNKLGIYIRKSCIKKSTEEIQPSHSKATKRQVTFSPEVRIHYPLSYPSELEEEDILTVVKDRLASSVITSRRGIRTSSKPFGQLGQGLPISDTSGVSPRPRFASEVTISRYHCFSVQVKPKIQVGVPSPSQREKVYGRRIRICPQPAHRPRRSFSSQLRQVAKSLSSITEESTGSQKLRMAGLKPRDFVSLTSTTPFFTHERARRSHHQLLTLETFSKTLF